MVKYSSLLFLVLCATLVFADGITKRNPATPDQTARDSIAAVTVRVDSSLARIQRVRDSLKTAAQFNFRQSDSLARTNDSLAVVKARGLRHSDSLKTVALRQVTLGDSLRKVSDSLTTVRSNLTSLFARDVTLGDSLRTARLYLLTLQDSTNDAWDSLMTWSPLLIEVRIASLRSQDSLKNVALRNATQSDSLKNAVTVNAQQSDSGKAAAIAIASNSGSIVLNTADIATQTGRNNTQSDSLKNLHNSNAAREAQQSDSLKSAVTVNAQQSDSLKAVATSAGTNTTNIATQTTRNNTQSDSLKNAATVNAQQSDSLRALFVGTGFVNLTGTTINWSLGGNFGDTLANTSGVLLDVEYAFSNVPTTYEKKIRVAVLNTDGFIALTWPGTIHWDGDDAPILGGADTLTVYEFTVDAPGQITGKVAARYFFGEEAASTDTSHPPAPAIAILQNTPSSVVLGWQQPENSNIRSSIVKVSPGVPIGEVSVTSSGGGDYPTVTKQTVSISSWPVNQASLDFTLPVTVDPSTSFWTQPTYEVRLDEPRGTYVTVVLSDDGTKVTLYKSYTGPFSGSPVISNIRFNVVTVSKWLTVTHHDSTIGSSVSSANFPVPAITAGHAFIMGAVDGASQDTKGSQMYSLAFTSTTNVQYNTTGSTGNAQRISFQVLRSDSFDVQDLTIVMGSGDNEESGTLSPAVDTTRTISRPTWIVGSSGVQTDIRKVLAYGQLENGTTYTMRRIGGTGLSLTAKVPVITFKAGWPVLVQRAFMSVTSGQTSNTVTLPESAAVERSVLWTTGFAGNRGATTASVDTVVSATFRIYYQDDLTIYASRVPLGYTTIVPLEALTFPVASSTSDTTAFDSLAAASYVSLESSEWGEYVAIRLDVQPGTTYYVRVKLVGANDSLSEMSNLLTFTTPTVMTDTDNGDWFIDGTSGDDTDAGTTFGTAFKTWPKVLSVAQEGDTIRATGNFTSTLNITGSNSTPIVIKGKSSSHPTWTLPSVSGTSALGIKFQNAKGWILDGVTITGGKYPIFMSLTENVTVKGSYIYDHWSDFGGITLRGCKQVTIEDNVIDGNARLKSVPYPAGSPAEGYAGIWITNEGAIQTTQTLIQDNTIRFHNHTSVLIGSRSRDTRVRNNSLYGNKIGLSSSYMSAKSVIEYNTVFWPSIFGMVQGHGGDVMHVTGDSVIVRFNDLSRDTAQLALADYYLVNVHSQKDVRTVNGVVTTNYWNLRGLSFYNNTCDNDVDGTPTSVPYITMRIYRNTEDTKEIIDNLTFLNNIFRGHDSILVQMHDYFDAQAAAWGKVTFDYNLFTRTTYAASKKVIQYSGAAGTSKYSLADINSAYGGRWLSHNIEGDPLFVDQATNDRHLQAGSPAIGTGGHLTVALNQASLPSTSLVVLNPLPFSAGGGTVEGDLIFIEGSEGPVRVRAIVGTTLTLSDPRTWDQDARVFFGSGTAPNIGAH